MAKLDPSILSHLEWLGFVQPTGLVVSPSALVQAGAILPRSDRETHQRLREVVSYDESAEAQPFTPVDFSTFATDVLGWGWSAKGYSGTGDSPIPESLQVHLPDYEETLIPDHAVKERDPADDALPWQLLVRCHEPGTDLDKPYRESRGTLEASPQGRLERLLRRNGVPAGLLYSGETLRLVSAPYGESSGWLDFRVGDRL